MDAPILKKCILQIEKSACNVYYFQTVISILRHITKNMTLHIYEVKDIIVNKVSCLSIYVV